jgi:pSer/pThr/pTyr-binding forkhead associated (FHA) protein
VRSNATHTQVTRAKALVEVNGTQHPLHPPAMVVGRGTEADIRINDPGVSRRHIEFQVAGQGGGLDVRVRDLGSTNGMLVDGHRISSTSLHDGSEVKIGNTTMTVRIVAETEKDPHV